MTTALAPTDYAKRSAEAYERQLREQLERHGTPQIAPEVAGRRAAVLAAAGQAWSDEVGPFYDTAGARIALGGITKQAVSQRVQGRSLLALRLAADGSGQERLVYPVWQFQSEVLRHLPSVLRAAGFDPQRASTGWTIAAWLTTTDPHLDGLSPVQLLRSGGVSRVLPLAGEVASSLGVAERATLQDSVRAATG